MKLLILGGTLFVGRHVVEAALARGHDVTLFHRGRTNPGLYPQVETLHGDRDGKLAALAGRSWDAVIDTSGYVPRIVRDSAELLANAVRHYTFISSGSVYADFSAPPIGESAPVLELADETNENIAEEYGALKARCEQVVAEVLGGRALAVRAGLIVGPHDPTGRFTYWITRIARGGEVLAPATPDRPVQFIDARDLASWTIEMAEAGTAGVYNVTGPAEPLTMGELLETIRDVTASDARFTWVEEEWLLERGVAPFSDLPLWLPAEMTGMLAMDVRKAVGAGLLLRPPAHTIRDTLERVAASGPPAGTREALPSGARREAGLPPERERALLAEWRTERARNRLEVP